jgi:flagellar biogenesis protein FliO
MKLLLLTSLLFSYSSFSKVNIKDVNFQSPGKIGKLIIKFDGKLNKYPEMKIHKGFIDVEIPDSSLTKTVNKKVSFSTKKSLDTQIKVSKNTGSSVKAKVILPFNVSKYESKVAMILKKSHIELTFPKMKADPSRLPRQVEKRTLGVTKEKLDASFLDKLIKEEEGKVKKVAAKLPSKMKAVKDAVTSKKAAVEKKGNKSFLTDYIGKFVAFLGVILVGFYGIVSLFKKGVSKKGKLGFLNKNEIVEVISNTFVAPKKSLMLVRAHEQVFLISNTDQGMQLISEVKDMNGLMKDGEKKVAGYNFDDKLDDSSADDEIESRVTLKEDINQSAPINTKEAIKDYLMPVGNDVKERVKFSDQIKKKVKDLKPMQ